MNITPGVLMPDGTTYYPSGREWLLVFALLGYDWAKIALVKREAEIWLGDGI